MALLTAVRIDTAFQTSDELSVACAVRTVKWQKQRAAHSAPLRKFGDVFEGVALATHIHVLLAVSLNKSGHRLARTNFHSKG
jgi:predicted signal transduction protein with EAL and GGDEF domain